MTTEKVVSFDSRTLTLLLLVLTSGVFLSLPIMSSNRASSRAVVVKSLPTRSLVAVPAKGSGPTAVAEATPPAPAPLQRAKWQSPLVMPQGMMPFRGKKGDDVFDAFILDAARQFDMDPVVIKAVIMAESGFNPRAVSRAGARGLMQLMPRTAGSLGVEDAFDPRANILGGTRYLKKLLQRFDGNLELALAAYNAGSRNVLKHRGIPPFKATHRYIAKVRIYYQHYRDQESETFG